MRKLIRGTAEIIFTLGLVGLLLCVHQLWWTNIESRAKADSNLESLDDAWRGDGTESPTVGDETGPTDIGTDGHQDGTSVDGAGTVRGKPFAKVYIPRLGKGFVKPIVEGTSLKSLAQGVGHYTYPPYTGPGETGNFGIAGHRNGHGEPFRYLNKLRPGDYVVIETETSWFTYRIVKGPYITKPTEGTVLAGNPPQLGLGAGQKLITLTTCDPEFTSKNRMVYWGTLQVADEKRPGFTPAALAR